MPVLLPDQGSVQPSHPIWRVGARLPRATPVPASYLLALVTGAIIAVAAPGVAAVDAGHTARTGWPGLLILATIGITVRSVDP